MPATATDRIEKRVGLRAPRTRVWRAIAADEFGTWFGVKLEGSFVEGATVRGPITHPGNDHFTMEVLERIEPQPRVSYRWHPGVPDPAVDYSKEPTTLVESGFDRIPLARRAEVIRMNDRGWIEQVENIRRHVA